MDRIYKLFLVIGVIAAVTRPLQANELSFGWGLEGTPNAEGRTYNWQIDYRLNFLKSWAWSASWINEGHFEGHHRDGFASQAWYRLPLSRRQFSLAFGIGADRWFDTQSDGQGGSLDVHGWAPIYSISATWLAKDPVLFRVTYNRIQPSDNIATNGVQLVVGYKLWKTAEDKLPVSKMEAELPDRATPLNEFTAFVGKTVVNTFNSESGVATGLELRKGVWKYCDWTLSWINEGNPDVIRRNGLATQLWLVDAFLNNHLEVGMGAGAYFYLDRKHEPVPGEEPAGSFAPLLTPTISWRFSDRWMTRFNWNRVVSSYNKDSDVFLLGLGYRWGQ